MDERTKFPGNTWSVSLLLYRPSGWMSLTNARKMVHGSMFRFSSGIFIAEHTDGDSNEIVVLVER